MIKKGEFPSYWWRRLCQLGCLFLFLFLFIKTDYSGRDEIEYAVNTVFRLDPLLALCASVAGGMLIPLMWPALITIGLTLVLGRFFCGWVCPMGTLIDDCHTLLRPRDEGRERKFRSWKFYLLGFLLVGAWFGLPAAGYFDPFSILVRGLALAVEPALNALSTTFFTITYQEAPDWVNAVTEPAYAFLKVTILPFSQKYYELTLLSLAILLLVFLLEKLERRFFCRNLCPLGALFAVTARYSLLRGRTGASCGKCRNCREVCRMGAIDSEKNISPLDCNLCLDCIHHCPGNFQGGLEGIFSPVLKGRIGYCEYNCTLCGQVCPTGAIRKPSGPEKKKIKIGNAYFNKNLCLPYAKGIPCIVCEEHCPTPDKAIKFRETVVANSKGEKVRVKQPYLVDNLCIGCGICENKCHLPGDAAIIVTSNGESRHPDKALPDTGEGGY